MTCARSRIECFNLLWNQITFQILKYASQKKDKNLMAFAEDIQGILPEVKEKMAKTYILHCRIRYCLVFFEWRNYFSNRELSGKSMNQLEQKLRQADRRIMAIQIMSYGSTNSRHYFTAPLYGNADSGTPIC